MKTKVSSRARMDRSRSSPTKGQISRNSENDSDGSGSSFSWFCFVTDQVVLQRKKAMAQKRLDALKKM